MLRIHLRETELYDEKLNEFVYVNEQDLELEHSLRSLAVWESKWKVPFISQQQLTSQQLLSYIECMSLHPIPRVEILYALTQEQLQEITDYILDSHTATTFKDNKQTPPNRKIITAELIYYQMIMYNIPLDFENRHLNHLLTLIDVFNHKSNPKKMSKAEIKKQNWALNQARMKQWGTKG